jgi:enamine deaminase RidA (YjgF/YER057c/UK114 family)
MRYAGAATLPEAARGRIDMTGRFTFVNPEGLHPTSGYAHLTIVEAGPTAHLAGVCPLDADEHVVGHGDLDAQIDQVVANALTILSAAGATPHDVIRSVIYVVSDDSAVLAKAWERLNASALAPAFATASTLLGVTALGYAGQLIEIDLTASLSEPRGSA